MARRTTRRSVEEDIEPDEVDLFHSNRSKILLNEAGEYGQQKSIDDVESEEEVFGESALGSDDDDEGGDDEEDDEEEEEEGDVDEEEEEGWGGRKNYYGGDEASDDEDSKQMTEEAMRQQRKHLEDLAMDDYIDEDIMEDWQKKADTFDNKEQQTTFTQKIMSSGTSIEQLDDNERLQLLRQSFPEFVPLMKELEILRPELDELRNIKSPNQCVQIKIAALSGYLASIASYFALFVENLQTQEDSFISMKDHPVMETILSSKEVWRQANELPMEVKDTVVALSSSTASGADVSSEFNEDEFVDAEEYNLEGEEEEAGERENDDDDNNPKLKNGSLDLDLDIDITKQRAIRKVANTAEDDYAEGNIEDVDMEDKKRRKKTLRFYTAKIDKAAAQREKAISGDMDVPYKERLFERQQRLVEEARKRGLEKRDIQGADEDDLNENNVEAGNYGDYDGDADNNDVYDGGDYYERLENRKHTKKENRKQAHIAAVKAAKEGKLAELQDEVGEDGKRAINYQILKNKGLTPHRKKEYRNSRVKKRKQYETAKKKLKSVRQVYDAEKHRGPYEGEKTGIKKGLSRSVKLV